MNDFTRNIFEWRTNIFGEFVCRDANWANNYAHTQVINECYVSGNLRWTPSINNHKICGKNTHQWYWTLHQWPVHDALIWKQIEKEKKNNELSFESIAVSFDRINELGSIPPRFKKSLPVINSIILLLQSKWEKLSALNIENFNFFKIWSRLSTGIQRTRPKLNSFNEDDPHTIHTHAHTRNSDFDVLRSYLNWTNSMNLSRGTLVVVIFRRLNRNWQSTEGDRNI